MDVGVIVPFFNPCGYTSLRKNAEKCVLALSKTCKQIFFVEAVYIGNAKQWAEPTRSPVLPWSVKRIRVRTSSILFAKEALLQQGLLALPSKCTKVLALDADILFEEENWLQQISQDLETVDVVQPFQTAKWLDYEGNVQSEKEGWAKSYKLDPLSEKARLFQSHCGFGFAAKRSYLNNGFFTFAVLGSGDEIHMRLAAGLKTTNQARFSYISSLLETYATKAHNGRLGYSALTVKHLPHGLLSNRQYVKRHLELIESGFTKDCLVESTMPEFKDSRWNGYFYAYFKSRKEDVHAPVQSCFQKFFLPAVRDTDILVDVRTGLFNRLRVLVAAVHGSNCTVWVHWPINAECSVHWKQFASSFPCIRWISSHQVIGIARLLPTSRVIGELNVNLRAPGPLKVLQSLQKSLPFSFKEMFHAVDFLPSIVSKAHKVFATLPADSCGLHIRRGDTVHLAKTLGKALPTLQDYVDFVGSDYAVVCTDDEDVMELLQKRFKSITILSDPKNSKKITTSHGSRKECGVDIVVSALVLSKCKSFMGTPTSSVTECIELWRKLT